MEHSINTETMSVGLGRRSAGRREIDRLQTPINHDRHVGTESVQGLPPCGPQILRMMHRPGLGQVAGCNSDCCAGRHGQRMTPPPELQQQRMQARGRRTRRCWRRHFIGQDQDPHAM